MGFIKLDDEASVKMKEKNKSAQQKQEGVEKLSWGQIIERILKYFFGSLAAPITLIIQSFLEKGKELKRDRLEFKYEDIKEQIQPGECHRFEFAYQAGRWFGYRPKPDTHLFSCKVNFTELHSNPSSNTDAANTTSNLQDNILQESTSIEISIFPSLSGMIFGTLIGSFLGTLTRNDFSFSGSDFWNNMKILSISLILGFIAGIILMRRKDVQSFITIEDLWGGILIGFIVAYSGRDIFERFLNITPDANQMLSNMTQTLPNMNQTLSDVSNT
jgi:F0F1-type ATP synthase assembly protein I